jgi:hypothetical protein
MKLNFSEKITDQIKAPKSLAREGFRLTSQETHHYTPPDLKPDLHKPREFDIRKYEGGTIEEALPSLSKALEQGYVVYWEGRQFTRADVNLLEKVQQIDLNQVNEPQLEEVA